MRISEDLPLLGWWSTVCKRSRKSGLQVMARLGSEGVLLTALFGSAYGQVDTRTTYHHDYPSVQLSNQTGFANRPSFSGDTAYVSNASPSTDGGPWNGGYVVATVGDGTADGARGHIVALLLNTYDAGNISGTSVTSLAGSGTNAMVGWGISGDPKTNGNCMGADPNWSCSADGPPFFWKGSLYWPIRSQSLIDFSGDQVAMVVCPDRRHCCNWGRFQAGGIGGPNTCDSGNWQSDGDGLINTTTTAGFNAVQWPRVVQNKNKMARLYVITWGQDTPTGPVPPTNLDARIDTAYTYALSCEANGNTCYAHRFLNSCANAPMIPACWTHWNGSTWVKNLEQVKNILPSRATTAGQTLAVFYNEFDGYFYLGLDPLFPLYKSRIPWGEWEKMDLPPVLPVGYNSFGFSSWMTHTLRKLSDGRTQISITNNAGLPEQKHSAMGFLELVLPAPAATVK